MKKQHLLFGIILIIIVVLGIVLLGRGNNNVALDDTSTMSLCYYSATPNEYGNDDTAWMILDITPSSLTGMFQNSPAMTDGMNVTFQNLISLETTSFGSQALINAVVMAEGMRTNEEVLVRFNADAAEFAFGVKDYIESEDRYVYADTSSLTWKALSEEDCNLVHDRIVVETYLRDMISEIAPVDPVLGGTWYVTHVTLNPENTSGTVIFEDGHILEERSFTYQRDGNSIEIQW